MQANLDWLGPFIESFMDSPDSAQTKDEQIRNRKDWGMNPFMWEKPEDTAHAMGIDPLEEEKRLKKLESESYPGRASLVEEANFSPTDYFRALMEGRR